MGVIQGALYHEQNTKCIPQQLSLSEGGDNATGASLLDVSESSLESLIANNLMNNFSLAVHILRNHWSRGRFIGNCFSASSFTLLNDIKTLD